jgi:hypothetical protein
VAQSGGGQVQSGGGLTQSGHGGGQLVAMHSQIMVVVRYS